MVARVVVLPNSSVVVRAAHVLCIYRLGGGTSGRGGAEAIWLDWATIRFRVFGPAARTTGSFCVFGPVLSSPAHGPSSLAMDQI